MSYSAVHHDIGLAFLSNLIYIVWGNEVFIITADISKDGSIIRNQKGLMSQGNNLFLFESYLNPIVTDFEAVSKNDPTKNEEHPDNVFSMQYLLRMKWFGKRN